MVRGVAVSVVFALGCASTTRAVLEQPGAEVVVVRDGDVTLHGMLFRPSGSGPFPAVLINHGSGRSKTDLARLGRYENAAEVMGPVFARHGYVCLFLFRRGVGPSADQGTNVIDLLDAAPTPDARNELQLQLQDRELSAATAGLAFLRGRPDVDRRRLALVGHSFGGSLTILQAEREPDIRAVVVFSAAGYSWNRSPPLRTRLLAALEHVRAPMFFIHAANDFSVDPGKDLDARLAELGKPHQLRIYPAVGDTAEEGHGLPYTAVTIWERDVFAFLADHMR